MLSTKHRFLFVHVPKTAGNSIQKILEPYCDDKIVCNAPYHDGVERFEVRSKIYRTFKHATIGGYRIEYGDEMLSGLFKFCCVRNPWDRALSHYFSPHRGQIAWDKREFLQFVEKNVWPLSCHLAADAQDFVNLRRAMRNINFVMRFESLQADFDVVCSKLGLPTASLPQLNKSDKAKFADYYDEETRQAIAERFRDEIEYFQYSFSNAEARQ